MQRTGSQCSCQETLQHTPPTAVASATQNVELHAKLVVRSGSGHKPYRIRYTCTQVLLLVPQHGIHAYNALGISAQLHCVTQTSMMHVAEND